MKIDFYLPTDREELQEILNIAYDAGYRWNAGNDLRDISYITGRRIKILCFNTESKLVTCVRKEENRPDVLKIKQKRELFRLLGIFVKPEVEVKARRISLSELRKVLGRKQ